MQTETRLYETVEDVRNREWAQKEANSRAASEYFKQGWYAGWGFVVVCLVMFVVGLIFYALTQ